MMQLKQCSEQSTSMVHRLRPIMTMQEAAKSMVPLLCNKSALKGEAGRIGIIGGCLEYTGAPYYAAMAALYTGADIAHIFCSESAASVIKSYSPELIVHPIFKERMLHGVGTLNNKAEVLKEIKNDMNHIASTWFHSLHSIIVGPGLGRDTGMTEATKCLMISAKEHGIPLIIDADACHILSNHSDVYDALRGYSKCVVTPNVKEYQRILDAMKCSTLESLCSTCFEDLVVIQKGPCDHIGVAVSGSKDVIKVDCDVQGSYKRSGGQGDILAGMLGTWMAWAHQSHVPASMVIVNEESSISGTSTELPSRVIACYAACRLSRDSSLKAFSIHQRAMTASNVLKQIGNAFQCTYDAVPQ